jgi:hypothetical protein
MQLVLAIHADRRQTELIAALLKKRAAVEVVQASDAGEGLQEIGDRIPDLILTSPLLSPFDEGVLAEYLRELGSAAAHVQTLRIPVMTMPDASSGGFFSRKKKRVEAAPDGCDPAYFVEEITQYLARAAEERKTAPPASWGTPAGDTAAQSAPSNEASEPYPMASSESSSYRPVSHSYSTSPVPDEFGRGESGSAFPIYQAPYNFDEPRIADPQPSAATYGADLGRVPGDVTPVYQPPFEAATPIYQAPVEAATPIDQAPAEAAPPIYQPPIETAAPIYQSAVETTPIDERPSFLDRLGPATSSYRRVVQPSAPIYHQPPPAADAPCYPVSVEPVVHVFEPPAQQPPPPVADAPDVTIEPQAHAHASLVLDPSQPEPLAADPPFVVHSTEDRIPLAESLERAAAELEASSLGDPMPARETERVPMHELSSIEEIPLPEELAARVERTAALHRPVAPEPTASAPPTAPTPSADADPRTRARLEMTSGSRSLLASPIDLDAPVRPEPLAAPALTTAPVAAVAADPALAPHANEKAPEPEKPATHKRTPSFEAALAAIRKAWGRQRGATSNLASPLSLNLNRTIEEPAAASPASAQVAPEPLTSPAIGDGLTIESDSSAREVDLTLDIEALDSKTLDIEALDSTTLDIEALDGKTLDIEALDDHGSVTVVETTVSEQVEIVAQPNDEDVYELSASPALHDLDADLDAAGPPPPVREMFPRSLVQHDEEATEVERSEQTASAPRKRDKHRKKSDKRRPVKAQRAADKPAEPPAPPQPQQPPEPAQDEWGLFDPNRCGFAALVDKLNEVTDEKDQKPTKTTVRVISYG